MATFDLLYQGLKQNATTFISTAADSQQMLYSTINPAQLGFLERLWFAYYSYLRDPVLATGIMSFLLHELVYFGRCLPWIAIDAMPYFRKWKLQPNKLPTAKQQWECTKAVLLVHFTVELPQIHAFYPLAASVGMKTYHLPFPSYLQMAYQIAIFFVIEDAWHYFGHRLFHYPYLYKRIHKLHHTYSAPFGLAAEYAHPIETLVLGAGTVCGPLAYCWWSGGDMHILTMYVWISLRLFQAIDSHSGYDFPWSLNKFFGLWSGADHHDYHHEKFIECYASSFRYLDWIFGTDKKFHAYRKLQAEQKRVAEQQAAKGGKAH
ncbi:fatty acid hydroxylase superfamily-domain-containing protein [Leucosporidium creatinivorum]|uniref:Fatty acid hydroxylase superfamily-domain-containing protein n=1 Tax=Leucosporidium creatinivorum TaxID=106004 RepID=A0A1Y2FKZ2_9BASI|nr:fatty acid hydroxylase superfamily-domain-containing protein [Leucosporidium creatinivorum]